MAARTVPRLRAPARRSSITHRAHYGSPAEKSRISLTANESSVIEFLEEVNDHYKLGNTLRIAGGWVRNKLLGKAGGDMDIALDKMTGATFCGHLRDLQVARGLEQRRIAVIRANPAQSKHLETATTKIFDETLDFVHLRSEMYDPTSRIPHVVFGTPKQDAERRDFTVNALYYSLRSAQVEDFTERGLDDLQTRLLRTPLEPLRTLLDDPLRALRCIRFVGQLNFAPVPDLLGALQRADVHQALASKVSRERVAAELTKMCLSPASFRSFELLAETGLASTIFDLDFTAWEESVRCLRLLESIDLAALSSESREALTIAAFLWPIFQQKNLSVQTIVDFFVLSLKASKRRGENVSHILAAARAAIPLLTDSHRTREDVSSWIRAAPTEVWRATILLAAQGSNMAAVLSLIAEIEAADPASVRAVQPLLNGSEIVAMLKLAPGPQRGAAAQALIRWQLANPHAGRAEAQQWIQGQRFYSTSSSSSSSAPDISSLAALRRSYQHSTLDETEVGRAPGPLFAKWYTEAALHSPPPLEANAMTLCTASKSGQPSSRTVLLRDFDMAITTFSFYGNGDTRKGKELADNPRVALVFYWPTLERQVRVEGIAESIDKARTSAVWATRPRESQIGTWASANTGRAIRDRSELNDSVRATEERFASQTTIDVPAHWAGWCIKAEMVEFFQGRAGRLHDRFVFRREAGDSQEWTRERVAP